MHSIGVATAKQCFRPYWKWQFLTFYRLVSLYTLWLICSLPKNVSSLFLPCGPQNLNQCIPIQDFERGSSYLRKDANSRWLKISLIKKHPAKMCRAVRETNLVLVSWPWTLVLEGSFTNPLMHRLWRVHWGQPFCWLISIHMLAQRHAQTHARLFFVTSFHPSLPSL